MRKQDSSILDTSLMRKSLFRENPASDIFSNGLLNNQKEDLIKKCLALREWRAPSTNAEQLLFKGIILKRKFKPFSENYLRIENFKKFFDLNAKLLETLEENGEVTISETFDNSYMDIKKVLRLSNCGTSTVDNIKMSLRKFLKEVGYTKKPRYLVNIEYILDEIGEYFTDILLIGGMDENGKPFAYMIFFVENTHVIMFDDYGYMADNNSHIRKSSFYYSSPDYLNRRGITSINNMRTGKSNILLDKFHENRPSSQQEFESILQSRHEELENFLNGGNNRTADSKYQEKEPLQAYKERAASIIYNDEL